MKRISLLLTMLLSMSTLAHATLTAGYVPVTKVGGSSPQTQNGSIYDTGTSAGSGNVGIGSTNPGKTLDVQGTVRASGGFIAGSGAAAISGDSNGNVGINQAAPAKTLDVNGSLKVIGITMTGSNPSNGYVLTSTDSAGDTTWSAAAASSQWTTANTNDVYLPNNGNVSIGTPGTTFAKLTVIGGNVSIGTTSPNGSLTVGSTSQTTIFSSGNVGIGTTTAGSPLVVTGTGSISLTTTGNVGIGTTNPGQFLDVQGTVRALGFTMSSATSGTIVCNLNGQFGHCSSSASCLTTCTCTCVVP